MPQVLVKLHPSTIAPQLSVSCETAEEREAFVKGPTVWWYAYPEDDDMLWRQGGAWNADTEPDPAQLQPLNLRPITREEEADDDRW